MCFLAIFSYSFQQASAVRTDHYLLIIAGMIPNLPTLTTIAQLGGMCSVSDSS
jgi:hypothetical protein